MKTIILFLLMSAVLVSCVKHGSQHHKIQPAKVEKADSNGVAKLTLTKEARARLGIESQPFLKDLRGIRAIPVSALLYDTKGIAWVFVETAPTEFHREQIQVLRTQGNQIQVESSFDDAVPIVTQGAAELNGAETGIGK